MFGQMSARELDLIRFDLIKDAQLVGRTGPANLADEPASRSGLSCLWPASRSQQKSRLLRAL